MKSILAIVFVMVGVSSAYASAATYKCDPKLADIQTAAQSGWKVEKLTATVDLQNKQIAVQDLAGATLTYSHPVQGYGTGTWQEYDYSADSTLGAPFHLNLRDYGVPYHSLMGEAARKITISIDLPKTEIAELAVVNFECK